MAKKKWVEVDVEKTINVGDEVTWLNENQKKLTGKVIERVRAKTRPVCEGTSRFEGKTKSSKSYVVEVNKTRHWIAEEVIQGGATKQQSEDKKLTVKARPPAKEKKEEIKSIVLVTPSINLEKEKMDINHLHERRIGVDDNARRSFDALQGFGKPYVRL